MKPRTVLILLFIASVAVLLAAPFAGSGSISRDAVLHPALDPRGATIFWDIRMPRVLTAYIAGMALAVSGMAFQAIFRNPLAEPFTLGVSSGAALGAVVYMRLGLSVSILGIPGASVAAFLGAAGSIGIVYGLTRLRGGFSSSALLLAGVAISFFFSSLVLAAQYTASLYDSFRLVRWMMGGLGVVGYDAALNSLPFVAAGVTLIGFMTSELNLMATGEDLALSRGVDVKHLKQLLFFAVSLMVGGVVAVCGPIGFVGMMAPHMCRLMVGPNHRALFPASMLFGGAFLTLADGIGRMAAAPIEVPVGVVTALLGGPFFLWLLFSGKASGLRD